MRVTQKTDKQFGKNPLPFSPFTYESFQIKFPTYFPAKLTIHYSIGKIDDKNVSKKNIEIQTVAFVHASKAKLKLNCTHFVGKYAGIRF